MGAFLDKPKTEKHNENGEGNGLRYGLSTMQGWRVEMEDAHTAIIGLPGAPHWSFFAVFDGHAGANVSAWCSAQLLPAITATLAAADTTSESSSSNQLSGFAQRLDAAVTAGNEAEEETENILKAMAAAVREGFLSLDASMRSHPDVTSGGDKSGSTATSVLITPSHLVFANCGDSRGVLSNGGTCTFSTRDHKPANPVEKDRIVAAGGTVMIQRVNGSLAVSRALGDYEYKQVDGKGPTEQLVSPEPEVSAIRRAGKDDEFVLLACDGIWDVMSNEEACAYVRHLLRLSSDLEWVCNRVIDCCLHKGSRDNMSVEVVTLDGAPSVSEEAQERERELEARLEAAIRDLFESSSEPLDLFNTNHHLMNLELEGLPPGGGLAAKHSEIEAIFNRLCKTQFVKGDEPELMSSEERAIDAPQASPCDSGEPHEGGNPDPCDADPKLSPDLSESARDTQMST